ncbi:MAG: S66 peptidase family protein [Ilyomonas sp.]
MIIPPDLKKGDAIGVVCPSGFMPIEKVQTCLDVLQQWGYHLKIGKTVGHQFHYFAGTDEERLSDLQTMLDDAEVKAILCARGGYGLSRIIDKINFTTFLQNPKWIIGYSDITVLHAHLNSVFHVASIHSPMASAFNDNGYQNEYVQSLKKVLQGECYQYTSSSNPFNKKGTATAELIGGNLALLAHLIGSVSDIDTNNKILFIEDIGEYIYNIDRMMLQLKHAGKLDNLSGLIVGSFTDMKDTTIPFGQTIYECIYDKVKEYSYPVCFDFPVGHTDKNYALKCGVHHLLSVEEDTVSLQELS